MLNCSAVAQETQDAAKDAEALADAMFGPGGPIEQATTEAQTYIDEQNTIREESLKSQDEAAATAKTGDAEFVMPTIENPTISEWTKNSYPECVSDERYSVAWCQCAAVAFADGANAGSWDHLAIHSYNDVRVRAAFMSPNSCSQYRQ